MCLAVLEEQSLPLDMFSKHLLPCMLNISHDPVPNVRLTLSRVMSGQIIPRGEFERTVTWVNKGKLNDWSISWLNWAG